MSDREISMGGETILLMDDEDMVLEIGSKILEKLGYTVYSAKSGKTGIDIYREKKDEIDLVILDMIMPDMDGGKTFDSLKSINPDIRALLTSGYSMNGSATEIMNKGCKGFIQKPFRMDEISSKIREILDH